jgi:hypothetical protein
MVVIPAVVGVLSLALTGVGAVLQADAFFQAYLLGYTFWLSLGLGCMGIVFVQFLTGGNWGLATRRIFEAGAATLPLLALLFIPLLFGVPRLYVWARPDEVAADPVLQHKQIYLNTPFFVARAIVYLLTWVVLALLLQRLSRAQDDHPHDPETLRRLQRFSIIGSLLLSATVSFAAIDWLMSLDADWFSTMYPPLIVMSALLVALAFGIVVVARIAPRTPVGEMMTPQVYNDLGNLLLAFVMLWTYLQYFQYLLIWAGNLSDEIPWYLERTQGAWLPVAVLLAVGGFAVPFWFLLFRPLKRNPRTLAAIAGLLVVMHLVDVYWLIAPPFQPGGPSLTWLDLTATLGIGGVWLAIFVWQLGVRPLLAPNDPRLPIALEAARELA